MVAKDRVIRIPCPKMFPGCPVLVGNILFYLVSIHLNFMIFSHVLLFQEITLMVNSAEIITALRKVCHLQCHQIDVCVHGSRNLL